MNAGRTKIAISNLSYANAFSIIIAATYHFFAGRPQQDRVLELSRVASFNVAQRRVRIDDAFIAQILEGHQVLGLSESVEPTATEGQRTEVLIDDAQQLFRFSQPVA